MNLSEDDARFLAKRTRLVKTWPPVGVVLLIGLGAFAGWLFWQVPLLGDPFAIQRRLQDDAVPVATMALATALLPIVFLLCLLLAGAVVLFVFAALSNEKRYLAILRRVAGGSAGTAPAADQGPRRPRSPGS